MIPDDKEDLNKFADEIFGSHDKPGTDRDGSSESMNNAHQKRVSRIAENDKWVKATKELVAEYQALARQPYEEGEYDSREGLMQAVHGGKVFVFRGGKDLWILGLLMLAVAGIFGLLSFSGFADKGEAALFFVIVFIPILLIGLVLLFQAMNSLLVVGPSGIVWRGGGVLWADVDTMNAGEKTVQTRYGERKKYYVLLQKCDGTAQRIALHHRTNEAPVTPPEEFIVQVVKAMYDVHGTK